MVAWIVIGAFVVLPPLLAPLALWRDWRAPVRPPPGGWRAFQARSKRRTVLPATLAIFALSGVELSVWAGSRTHGAAYEWCNAGFCVSGLAMMVFLVLCVTVSRYNRPSAFVPPAMRNDLGLEALYEVAVEVEITQEEASP